MSVNIKCFWEKCDKTFAHISIDKWLSNYKTITDMWQKMFINQLLSFTELENKTIVDYGIGGGYLGVYLHETYHIDKYIGIDIAQRSLDSAYQNLQDNHVNNELYLAPVQFKNFNADIFVCQAVIQHFPDESYFQDFLININQSNIKYVMLQIRFNKQTVFNNDTYNTNISIESVKYKCRTNNSYVLKFLNNYDNIYESNIDGRNYQFLIYRLQEI